MSSDTVIDIPMSIYYCAQTRLGLPLVLSAGMLTKKKDTTMTKPQIKEAITHLAKQSRQSGDSVMLTKCKRAIGYGLYNEMGYLAELDICIADYVDAICDSLDAGDEGWIEVNGTRCYAY